MLRVGDRIAWDDGDGVTNPYNLGCGTVIGVENMRVFGDHKAPYYHVVEDQFGSRHWVAEEDLYLQSSLEVN